MEVAFIKNYWVKLTLGQSQGLAYIDIIEVNKSVEEVDIDKGRIYKQLTYKISLKVNERE